MFKAQRKDGKGEARGWLVLSSTAKTPFIYTELNTYTTGIEIKVANSHQHEIIPSTLSMQTGQTDKNGEMIYGSFMLDRKMTERKYVLVEGEKYYVEFDGGSWMLKSDDKDMGWHFLYQCGSALLEIVKGE